MAKQQYWSTYFENNKNNLKRTWKGINIKNVVSSNSIHLKINNSNIEDSKEIINSFNNFFANVGPATEKNIPKAVRSLTYYLRNRSQIDFVIAHATEDEILKIILSIDEHKAIGPSIIPIKLLNIAVPYIIIPICNLINLYIFFNRNVPCSNTNC